MKDLDLCWISCQDLPITKCRFGGNYEKLQCLLRRNLELDSFGSWVFLEEKNRKQICSAMTSGCCHLLCVRIYFCHYKSYIGSVKSNWKAYPCLYDWQFLSGSMCEIAVACSEIWCRDNVSLKQRHESKIENDMSHRARGKKKKKRERKKFSFGGRLCVQTHMLKLHGLLYEQFTHGKKLFTMFPTRNSCFQGFMHFERHCLAICPLWQSFPPFYFCFLSFSKRK